ncbi:MAG TPA: DUF2231 domain-containing protein [Tepidisphaeraceae bacterium]
MARAGAGGGSGFLQLPPLHPILVNFTAALVPASLISDVLGRLFRKQSLLSAGWWMLLYAAVITPFTALAGWWWLRQMGGMDVPEMAIHKWLGTALAVVFVALVFWRWHIHRSASAPGWLYLICAAAVVSLLTLQGHLGGSMSFASNQDMSNSAPGNPAHLSSSGRTGEGGLQWRDHINLKDDR